MGLDELYPFNLNEKIIEYRIKKTLDTLVTMQINEFADELSSDSPAPGGGSVSALVGVLGAALVAMVANLTFGKKKWESNYKEMCNISEDSQVLKYKLLKLIDSDTSAFNNVLDAYRLPGKSKKQQISKDKAILKAMKKAVNIPFEIMQCCYKVLQSTSKVVKNGNPNAISDAGVAAEIAYSALRGAVLNIEINLKEINDSKYSIDIRKSLSLTLFKAEQELINIRKIVSKRING